MERLPSMLYAQFHHCNDSNGDDADNHNNEDNNNKLPKTEGGDCETTPEFPGYL